MRTFLVVISVFCLANGSSAQNRRRQMPDMRRIVAERRVDGTLVYGSANELPVVDPKNSFQPPGQFNPELENVDNSLLTNEIEDLPQEEPGFIDSVFGEGAQSRIVTSVNDWVVSKAKSNPGCVERFVCETYRTGETLEGIPYVLMSLTNAAVSFYVADMFDTSVDIKELTRAARTGRTVGSCTNMECDFMNGQLRTIGDYLETIEEFVSSLMTSLSGQISSLGRK